MTPSLGMYNMNSNYGWQGLLQQGIGMLGGNYSNANFVFGNNGCFGGSGRFTNCYGEVDYDAMAGYGVANAVLGVVGQAVAAKQANKEPEVNYTQELAKINKEIETKEIDKAEQTDIINTKTDEIKTATNTKTNLEGDLTTAKNTLEEHKKELNAATNLTEDQRKTLEAKIAQAEKDVKAVEEKIAAQDKIIKEATEAKKAAETKEAALQKEIDELKKKQTEYQKAIDAATIKDSKSVSWKRADVSCIDRWQTKQAGVLASEKEINRASYEYRHTDKADEKKKYATALINMYESNPDGLKKYKCLYEAVKREQNM